MNEDEDLADADRAAGLLDALGGRPGVRCWFDCPRSQRNWQVRRAVVREGLSRPYRVDLSLVTLEVDADPDELVGSTCEFVFDRGTRARVFRGVVLRVQVRGISHVAGGVPGLAIEVEFGPALATMAQRINCRIFQEMTVPEILRDVLLGLQAPAGAPAEGLAAYDRTLADDGLAASDYSPPRDYCVQYKESDLDFALRLMHEEGIVFVFDQDQGDAEVLRLVDRETTLPVFAAADGSAQLPVDRGGDDRRDAITHLVVERVASPSKLAVMHHDWLLPTRPARDAGSTATRGAMAGNEREVYLPSERRVREIYADGKITASHDDSPRRLDLAAAQLMADEFVARGTSNACGLEAGMVFDVDHGAAFDRMVALELVHEITIEGDRLDVPGSYENHFVGVPSSRFATASVGLPRPVMRGPQTATVTGPENEDIHTDAFGRIKLLMHWDREGEGRGRPRRADASSSVWVRVAQSWGGSAWGTLFIPRVGMEVLVDFLDGNPDRPVVVGCLYNGANPPPYPLPDERTRSTIRTRSTPSNGGYNELRFDDAAELEEIYIRAQRDMNELVQRNHTTDVKVDQSHSVGRDRTRRVGGHEAITITGNRTLTVDGSGGAGFSGEAIKVTNDYKLEVAKTIYIEAPVEILIQCEGSSIRMTPNQITLQAGGGAKLVLDANALVESNDASRALFDANVEVRASTGAQLKLDADARVTANDKGELYLTADALITSNGDGHALFHSDKITIDSGEATIVIEKKEIRLDGDDIAAKAETKLALEGGGGRLGLSGGKAQVN